MYYDPYKLGFVYYSDTNIMNVSLLNAAAMKYCISYRCRDFFVDNGVTPENRHSALIPIHFIEPPVQPKATDKPATKLDNSAFAKFKNYSKQTENAHPNNKNGSNISPTVQPPKDACKNRFIYMGKMNNMKLLQPIKKYTNTINGFKSQHLDNLKGETQLQQRVLSYKDFKRNNDKKGA